MSGKGKKRKKAYYVQKAKKFKSHLEIGMKGFLLTCNNKEALSVREAYNILNEYADKLYGPQKVEEKVESDEEEEDIETALKKEVTELQETAKSSQFRYKSVDSGAKNCIFIKTTLENPTAIADSIFSDLYETRTAKSRYIMRFLPVQVTCKANEEAIKKAAAELFPQFFCATHTYSIMFKVRNNNTVSRNQVMPAIFEAVNDLNPFNSVDLKNPDFVINVDIIKTVCCLSVLKDYLKYKKYNIQEVTSAKDDEKKVETVKKDTDGTENSKVSSDNPGDDPATGEVPSTDQTGTNEQSQCEKPSKAEGDNNSKVEEKDVNGKEHCPVDNTVKSQNDSETQES